jgi:catechol 2,3-dioxygenase-like lactoylglutathione lyase family enzyme
MKINVVNTILYCRNWSECVAFYRDDLKLAVNLAKEWFVEFKLNEAACLSVVDASRAWVGPGSGEGVMVSLKVDDLAAVRSEMETTGLDPTPVEEVWGAEVFSIFDPEGVRLEFWSLKKD